MHLDYSPAQLELKAELQAYFAELLPPEKQAILAGGLGHGGEFAKEIRLKMGQDGWLGVGWPTEYGGRNLTALEQFIFFDEANRVRAPIPFISLNTVGPTLMKYGSEDHKNKYLPPILAGEQDWAIGYSEPEAGTDLASLTTRAVRDGDEYVINGSKVFTSGGDSVDYIWLAARTGTVESRHRGITIFIVPTDTPGFSTAPLHVMGGGHTNFSFYENVRVPAENVILGENEGWKLITSQLNHERAAMAATSGGWFAIYDAVVDWAQQEKTTSGARVIDQEWVQMLLARCLAKIEAVRLSNWKVAAALNEGTLTPAHSSASKIIGTESHQEVARLLLEVVGQQGYLRRGSASAILAGRVEQQYRGAIVGTFGGGNNEIQRELIGWTALDLPRGKR